MANAVVLRSEVLPGLPYAEYRDSLRYDFWFACAYCGITEVEATSISFEIDHFQPVAKGGTDDYDNLMWCCHQCNNKKLDYWPSPAVMSQGYRYVRPDQDDPNAHFRVGDNGSVRVEPVTNAGTWTNEIIDLNRAPLRKVREARLALFESKESIAFGLARLSASKRGIDQLKQDMRAQYLHAVQSAREQAETLQETLEELAFETFIRQMNKSSNIQDPEERRDHTQRRRQFLKGLNAKYPEYSE